MSLLLLLRNAGTYVPPPTQGIGRALRALPGRLVIQAATRHADSASARPAGSVATRRNTQGRTR